MRGLLVQRRTRVLASLATLLGMVTCAPPPDPDGLMGGAATLPLGSWQTDQLYCRKGDCADWYRLKVPGAGDLKVVVVASQESDGARPFTLKLAGGRGEALTASANAGAGNAAVSWKVEGGWYLVEVSSADRERRPLPYEIQAIYKAPPPPPAPPPAPRFRTVSAEVLEVEGRPGAPTSVLIGAGEKDGIRPGQRGRLVEDGLEIGSIEIQDSYPEGSRARIDGALAAPVTPATVAEIEVPLDEP